MGAEFLFSVITTLSGLLASLRRSAGSALSKGEGACDGIERDLDRLERLLQRIQVTLYDAGEREIRDASVKLWLKELKQVAYEAEDILDECQYEVLRCRIEDSGEAIAASLARNGRKRKSIEDAAIPDGFACSIKRVLDRFEEICRDREALLLREDDGERRDCAVTGLLPTGHMVNESAIFGRDGDKKKILDFVLLGNRGGANHISVVPIVGMGGVGKTTLAQFVYNDPLVKCYFDMSAWVYVSPEFDVTRITKEVLESIAEKVYTGLTGLSAVQQVLVKEIKGKKVFLVLDDVWNELFSKWEQFLEPLRVAESVRIIVTTRNKPVGQIVQTTYTCDLSCLSQDQSRLLFEHYAFRGRTIQDSSSLREIGAQIVNKCGGLPLAIKSVSRALSCKLHEDSWIGILESELWESDCKDEIFPALKVSYYSLPPELKPCLLFCSLFPKGYRFDKDQIIYMWIAHGYVQSRGSKSEEDIGDEFIHELDRRSFLMIDQLRWEETFTLHDLIHDLARSISMGEFLTSTRGSIGDVISSQVHHVYTENYSTIINASNGSSLLIRTLVNNVQVHKSDLDYNLHMDINTNLRVLKCEGAYGHDFERMVNPKHLRYLELSHSILERLSKSVILLFNLVALRIGFLHYLKELPVHIGNLVSLRYLSITSVGIKELPESLGQLSNLQMLHLCSCPKITKLPVCIGILINLKQLYLSNLSLTELPESCCMLNKLQTLVLVRCWYIKQLPDRIGNLINLQYMYFLGVLFKKLPESINQLCNLEVLELTTSCASLMGLLSRLEGLLYKVSLKISIERKGVSELEEWIKEWTQRTDDGATEEARKVARLLRLGKSRIFTRTTLQFRGSKYIKYIKSKSLLECLQPINHLIELKLNAYEGIGYPRWLGTNYNNGVAIFLHCFLNNSKFFAELGELPSLKSLHLIGGNIGDYFFQTIAAHDFKVIFPSLEEIEFTDILERNVPVVEQHRDLPVLCNLKIDNCPILSSLPKFALVKRLEIIRCSFSMLEFNTLHWRLLESLHIEECIQLTSLHGLQSLSSLRTLYVVRCPQLEEFSYPRNLTLPLCIEIVECPSLKGWCQSQQFNYIKNFSCKMLATSGIWNIMKQGDQVIPVEHLLIENSIEKSLGFHIGLCNLVRLEIKSCWKLETLKGLSELKFLVTLILWDCPLLRLENTDSESGSCLSPYLMSLIVHGCHYMLSLDLLLLENPSTLTELEITNCRQLMSIGGLQNLTELETLVIIHCPRLLLELLPIVPDCVVISGCPRLKAWCRMHSIDPLDDETD